MPSEKRGARSLKAKVLGLLQVDDFLTGLEELKALPGRQVINPLFSFLLHHDQRVRWRAVTAMGAVIANLAESDMESARVIMRRLMWSLNDESGGIGWGAPEVMGEAMSRNDRVAEEYASILVSYADEEGNFLEYEILQRGLLWGLARLAGTQPHLVEPVAPHLGKYLESDDTFVRGLAARLAGLLRLESFRDKLLKLSDDPSELNRFINDKTVGVPVSDLAREALSLLDGRNES